MDILGGARQAPRSLTIRGWSKLLRMSISRLNSTSCGRVAPTPPRCSSFTATSLDAGLTSAARYTTPDAPCPSGSSSTIRVSNSAGVISKYSPTPVSLEILDATDAEVLPVKVRSNASCSSSSSFSSSSPSSSSSFASSPSSAAASSAGESMTTPGRYEPPPNSDAASELLYKPLDLAKLAPPRLRPTEGSGSTPQPNDNDISPDRPERTDLSDL